jgi:hypothetical protein
LSQSVADRRSSSQARFDAFVHEFNAERPHEALGMQRPAEVDLPSSRPYDELPELAYPLHDRNDLGRPPRRASRPPFGPTDGGDLVLHSLMSNIR